MSSGKTRSVKANTERDRVDLIVEQWERERPDLDASFMETVGRILRASRHIDQRLHRVFEQFALDFGLFDVLATLRRQGSPYQLPPSALNEWCMLTSGAMTKRLDRLERLGLVTRKGDPADRRGVIVELSVKGLAVVDQVVAAHVENERQILAPLTSKQRRALGELLRPLLIHLERMEEGSGR